MASFLVDSVACKARRFISRVDKDARPVEPTKHRRCAAITAQGDALGKDSPMRTRAEGPAHRFWLRRPLSHIQKCSAEISGISEGFRRHDGQLLAREKRDMQRA